MMDFVIVVAALASVASAAPPAAIGPGALPKRTPTVGFNTYNTIETCEGAAAKLVARPGTRLVCLPVEPPLGGLVNAY